MLETWQTFIFDMPCVTLSLIVSEMNYSKSSHCKNQIHMHLSWIAFIRIYSPRKPNDM